MASSAMDIRSPAVNSMSSSRPCGLSLTWLASAIRSSVVPPIAETTTMTSLPARRVSETRLATLLILSGSATDEPPNF